MAAPSTYHLTGLGIDYRPAGPIPGSADRPSMAAFAPSPTGNRMRAILDPGDPLFWFAVVFAATLGLIGIAGAVRVGPGRVAGSLGDA